MARLILLSLVYDIKLSGMLDVNYVYEINFKK